MACLISSLGTARSLAFFRKFLGIFCAVKSGTDGALSEREFRFFSSTKHALYGSAAARCACVCSSDYGALIRLNYLRGEIHWRRENGRQSIDFPCGR
jgi:hypothetical protein